jgi:hypothetical protein
LAQLSKISSLNWLYARLRFGLSPSGGSLVSLMLFCRRLMGRPRSKAGGGSAERNSLTRHNESVAERQTFTAFRKKK